MLFQLHINALLARNNFNQRFEKKAESLAIMWEAKLPLSQPILCLLSLFTIPDSLPTPDLHFKVLGFQPIYYLQHWYHSDLTCNSEEVHSLTCTLCDID